MKLAVVVACIIPSIVAAADPPRLGKVVVDGIGVSLPPHWVVNADAKSGTVVARLDPKRKDAPILTVAIKLVAEGATDDALLQGMLSVAKDVKLLAREAVPGGKGQAVVAEGTVDGIHVKLGAIASVGQGRATIGLLAATPAEFDAIGGVQTLLASLRSLHPVDQSENNIEQTLGRPAKRSDQPDLDPDRPALSRDRLLAGWTHASGSWRFSETRRSGNTAYGYTDGSGNSESYRFARDGSYRLQTLTTVDLNGCASKGIGVELGSYSFDGKTLVLSPRSATTSTSICGKPPVPEAVKNTPPRRYDVGMASDGRLIFVGTGCTPFPQGTCGDHVRWEMTAETK